MSSLGSFFPAEECKKSVKRQLKPGTVIKLFVSMDDGKYHEKRFVVLSCTESTLTCVINSAINGFIQNRPDMLRCQVEICAADYEYMDHDSYIDCSRVRAYASDEIIQQLVDKPEWILGSIKIELAEDILSGLKHSPLIAPSEIDSIESTLRSEYQDD